MIRRTLILVPIVLSACAMPPKGVDEAAVARFDNAVISMNCQLITEPHYLAAEFQTGLTREQVVEMVGYKIAIEEAAPIEAGGYQFTMEGCA